MAWGVADIETEVAVARGMARRLMEYDLRVAREKKLRAAARRHAKALPTGMGLSKGERKKLRAAIALYIRMAAK